MHQTPPAVTRGALDVAVDEDGSKTSAGHAESGFVLPSSPWLISLSPLMI